MLTPPPLLSFEAADAEALLLSVAIPDADSLQMESGTVVNDG
ncbi:hypothetical protein ECMP0215528_5159 [Escherichia coli MP021552.8]|nr:hypothetical protein ECMP0215528_5159 [Escherichia coli MP021552.8]